MKQQKCTLFDKLIPFFVSNENSREIPMTSAFKQKSIQNAIVGKRHEVHRVYSKDVKVSEFSLFSTT